MSTHIIDRIVAIRIPKQHMGDATYFDDAFVVLHLGGDNNVISRATNRRAKSWYVSAIGEENDVLRCACEFASDCVGNSMNIRSRHTTPESFIKAYRNALAEAIPLADAAKHGFTLTARIKFHPPNASEIWKDREQSRYETAIAAGKKPSEEVEYKTTYHVVEFDIFDPADCQLWYRCRLFRGGSSNMGVDGPGET